MPPIARSTAAWIAGSCIVMSACSSGIPVSTPTGDGLPANVRNWELPLTSQWSKIRAESNLIAEDFWVAQCMGAPTDLPATVQAFTARQQPGVTWNSDLRRLFTPEIAGQYGYRTSSTFADHAENPNEMKGESTDKRQGCFDRLRQEFPLPPYDGAVQRIQSVAFGAARQQPEVLDAAKRWQECLTKQTGISPPPSPMDMPTEDLVKKFDIPRDLSGTPTAPEISLALADAKCQISSGFTLTLHTAEVAAQQALISEDPKVVQDEIKDFRRYDAEMQGLLDGTE